MEPEGSLPCSQEPTTGPNSEPDNQINTTPSYLSKIDFNIFHPPTSWSSQWSLSFWLSHQYPIYILLLPIRVTCPTHLILFDLIVLITFDEEDDDGDDDNNNNNNTLQGLNLSARSVVKHQAIFFLASLDHFFLSAANENLLGNSF
jgi:hypothetical protein